MVLTRKIKLYPIGDKEEVNRVYKFIRDGQYAQYQGLNLLMGQLSSSYYKNGRDLKNENFIKEQKEILTHNNELLQNIEFSTGVDTKSLIRNRIRQDFSTAIKNGLARGERSIANYKRTYPLLTNGRNLKFSHPYDSYQEFLDKLYTNDLEVTLSWVNKIKFNVIFGSTHRSAYLREEIKEIFEENYKVCGSSIQIDDKEIILNLSIDVPKKEIELDENTVVGVDLGIAIPAVCSLNNNDYKKQYIGSKDDFLRIRTQLQSQRKRLQISLKYTNGGHGKNKRLKALDRLSKRERNFVKTYNHTVSKSVVDFAVKNNAKYINMECLKGYDSSEFILRNWSFYELQTQITYKAAKYGIVVRTINPCYTSQVCSCCGHWEEGQRISQSEFVCKSCGTLLNADLNGSRNIAKSKLWCEDKITLRLKIEAKEYYNIPLTEEEIKKKKGYEEEDKKKKEKKSKKKKE